MSRSGKTHLVSLSLHINLKHRSKRAWFGSDDDIVPRLESSLPKVPRTFRELLEDVALKKSPKSEANEDQF